MQSRMRAEDTAISSLIQLLTFAERHSKSNPTYRHPLDRRKEQRRLIVAPATIQPVTNQLAPLGAAADVVTRDISKSGIALVLDESPTHKLYTVEAILPDELEISVLATVVWSDLRPPFHIVGMSIMRWLKIGGQRRLL